MYKGASIWDEEGEKYEKIKEETKVDIDYHDQGDYNSGGGKSDLYNSDKGKEDDKKEKEVTGIEKEVSKGEKKYESKGATDEEIKKKAASEVQKEGGSGDDSGKKKKKAHKSIEDAINKAMKEEKKVIYVDD